jgi:hypothetical protein
MVRASVILLTLLFLGAQGLRAQKGIRDSVYRLPVVGLHLSGQLPGGDLSKRFGGNMSVGMPVFYKTAKNLVFGIEGNYFFGTKIKEQVMSNLLTPDGTITDVNGNPATFRLNERGWNVYGYFGKLFNRLGHNKNSGLLAWAGLGYMQHKVNIYDVGKTLIQIDGDLVKGYDRLTGGFACTQFIGYLFMSQNRITNFYAGLEMQEGFTTGLRGYQFDTMKSDKESRLDLLYGIRFGWLLPLYKKAPRDFYYY